MTNPFYPYIPDDNTAWNIVWASLGGCILVILLCCLKEVWRWRCCRPRQALPVTDPNATQEDSTVVEDHAPVNDGGRHDDASQ